MGETKFRSVSIKAGLYRATKEACGCDVGVVWVCGSVTCLCPCFHPWLFLGPFLLQVGMLAEEKFRLCSGSWKCMSRGKMH